MKKRGGYNVITSIPSSDITIWLRKELQVNKVLQDIYEMQAVKDAEGNMIKFNSGISPKEGWFLYNLVKENNIKTILEIGMAYGTSALYICQALKDTKGHLTSIDPFQSSQWKSIGVLNIKRAGLSKYHKLIETGSETALPALLKKKQFDMIFIDGMHLFDYTLIDIFYAVKLIKIGGIIVIDDIKHNGVKKAIDYIKSNYTFLKIINNTVSSNTMAAFVKITEDKRNWNFHKNF